MTREIDAADSLGEGGDPEADRHLAENFGMTVRQVRAFDPQTLDVTLACKFLGLPLKRFDLLAPNRRHVPGGSNPSRGRRKT